MIKKIVLIIVLVIVLGLLVYWYQTTKPLEKEKSEILNLLNQLEQETNINFSNIKDIEIEWNTKQGIQIIQGKGYEANYISNESYDKIDSFFQSNNFEIDVYNVAAGTVSGLTGYKKVSSENSEEQIVCIIIAGVSGYKKAVGQWIPSDPDKTDVEIMCGKNEASVELLVSTKELVKNLFAEKYDKDLTEVAVNIDKETKNHVFGSVVFGQGGQGEGGMFLAVKVNGVWELVYDGNGSISCSAVDPYDFPVDMVPECIEEDSQPRDRIGQACVDSGGIIEKSLCCKSSNEFPNLCLIGACGCSPDNSYEVRVCNCEEGKCFNGCECVLK